MWETARRMFKRICILACVVSLCAGMHVEAAEATESVKDAECEAAISLFEDGDVVGFIGDSITHAQYCSVNYVETLYQYYLSRFPEREVEFRNLGTAGFKACDVLNIYDQDPAFGGINKAVIMLGTNEAILKTSTADYISNMEALIERLKLDGMEGADILVLSPPICDEMYAKSAYWAFEDRILQYLDALAQKTAEWGVNYLDIHTPLAELTAQVRKENPTFTITVKDAIHPSEIGQQLIAYYILKAQGADCDSTEIWVPGEGDAKEELEEYSDYFRTEKGLYLPLDTEWLPIAETEKLKEFLDFYEPASSLYQKRLRVTGLPEECIYRVFVGEDMAGSYTGAELKDGINLAVLSAQQLNPDLSRLWELNGRWYREGRKYRAIWIDVMMQRVTYTEEQIKSQYERWRTVDEALRAEMCALVQSAVAGERRIAIIEEGYSVTELELEAMRAQEVEERARKEAEERARKEAEERALREAEERARREAEERALREAEERARKEAEELALREAEERARKDAEEQAQKETKAQIGKVMSAILVIIVCLALPALLYKIRRMR